MKEYIITKDKRIPQNTAEIENGVWFNMWKRKEFPYIELNEGDILYWLDTIKKRLVWKTEVLDVVRKPYTDKGAIKREYGNYMSLPYYDSKAASGYFLLYKVKVISKIDVIKPKYNFSRLGWEEVTLQKRMLWFNNQMSEDREVLDDSFSSDNISITRKLHKLNEKMKDVSPERILSIVNTTIRKDTKIIKMLKQAASYKCQFPGCGHQIKTKDGSYYIEVAHIKPVKLDGKSVLGNLIVLCPNHHKEFDFGDLSYTQTEKEITGQLNGKDFVIKLDFDN